MYFDVLIRVLISQNDEATPTELALLPSPPQQQKTKLEPIEVT